MSYLSREGLPEKTLILIAQLQFITDPDERRKLEIALCADLIEYRRFSMQRCKFEGLEGTVLYENWQQAVRWWIKNSTS